VFRLGPMSGCAVSGSNSYDIFSAVRRLTKAFGDVIPESSEVARQTIEKALMAADREARTRSGNDPDYSVVVASYVQSGDVSLFCVGNESQVDGQSLPDGVLVIGDRNLQPVFLERLRNVVENATAHGTPPQTPEQQASMVGFTIYDCIRDRLSPVVGGGVQLALITPERGYEQSAVTLWRQREGVDHFDVITPAVSADHTRGRPRGQHVPIDFIRLADRLRAEADKGDPV